MSDNPDEVDIRARLEAVQWALTKAEDPFVQQVLRDCEKLLGSLLPPVSATLALDLHHAGVRA